MSIRKSFLLWTVPLMLIVQIIGSAGVLSLVRSQLLSQLDRSLSERAQSFVTMIFLEEDRIELDYDGELTHQQLGVWIDLRENGQLILQSPDIPGVVQLHEKQGNRYRTIEIDTHSRARLISISFHPNVDPDHATPELVEAASEHTLQLSVVGSLGAVDRATSAVKFALIFSGLATSIAMVLAVLWSTHRGLSPIRFLSKRIEHLHPDGGPNQIDPRSSPIELRSMCEALRAMLTRARASIERERLFADAAAHELRTPIAELRAATDIAQRWPEPERLQNAINQSSEIAAEMEVLIECLLASTRGNGASLLDRSEQIFLVEFVTSLSFQDFECARKRSISCSVHGDPDASWTIARGAALAILRNVIQNATDYTPNGGSVTVEVEQNDVESRVIVQNAPVTMSEHEVSVMFDPFWRSDESRADTKHKGLGLAIVRSACDLVGIACAAELIDDSVLRITLSQSKEL